MLYLDIPMGFLW